MMADRLGAAMFAAGCAGGWVAASMYAARRARLRWRRQRHADAAKTAELARRQTGGVQ